MRIRKATLRDVGGILILCKKLEDSHHKEKAGKNSAGYISDLYVEEKYRKSGLGSELIKEAQEWLRKKGKKNVTLHVESWNIGAINLYRKLEFKDKSIRMEKKL